MGTTILPAFLGMNLSSGMSDQEPYFFYAVRFLLCFGLGSGHGFGSRVEVTGVKGCGRPDSHTAHVVGG
jgi:hypothetical protein